MYYFCIIANRHFNILKQRALVFGLWRTFTHLLPLRCYRCRILLLIPQHRGKIITSWIFVCCAWLLVFLFTINVSCVCVCVYLYSKQFTLMLTTSADLTSAPLADPYSLCIPGNNASTVHSLCIWMIHTRTAGKHYKRHMWNLQMFACL